MLTLGDEIPNLPIHGTSSITGHLHDFIGQGLLLYFYPRDATPGCTQEGQDFRDYYSKFQELGITLFGISRDHLASHERFKAKYAFPFELLADEDETLCQAFGVMKMKNMYGKQVRGIERSTFLIDSSGKIQHLWRGVKVAGHVEDVLQAIEKR